MYWKNFTEASSGGATCESELIGNVFIMKLGLVNLLEK